ncbi:hypothetical protein FB451DRAFT_1285372 [Mycena latifolia]|nr:hypothetical protein FB451DRAFT_1285372 [Mycena latifolia]
MSGRRLWCVFLLFFFGRVLHSLFILSPVLLHAVCRVLPWSPVLSPHTPLRRLPCPPLPLQSTPLFNVSPSMLRVHAPCPPRIPLHIGHSLPAAVSFFPALLARAIFCGTFSIS